MPFWCCSLDGKALQSLASGRVGPIVSFVSVEINEVLFYKTDLVTCVYCPGGVRSVWIMRRSFSNVFLPAYVCGFFFVILMVAFPKSNIQRCRCVIISLFVFWRFCFYCFFLFWFGSKGLLHDLSIFFYLSSCLFLKIHLERQGKSWKGNYRARRKWSSLFHFKRAIVSCQFFHRSLQNP